MKSHNYALLLLGLFACSGATFAMDAMSNDDSGKAKMKMQKDMNKDPMKSEAKDTGKMDKKAHSGRMNDQMKGRARKQDSMQRVQ